MVTQVLVRALDSGSPEFLAVDNPQNRDPISFEDRAQKIRVPRLGSQDLLYIASFALAHGFELDAFELVNESLERLDQDEQEAISDVLIEALLSRGPEEALRLLVESYPATGIVGVEFVDGEHHGFVIRRNGVADAEPGASPLDLLTSAWPTVRFG